jgi:predicted RNase H-like nuclease (RuvC/YqgF family)
MCEKNCNNQTQAIDQLTRTITRQQTEINWLKRRTTESETSAINSFQLYCDRLAEVNELRTELSQTNRTLWLALVTGAAIISSAWLVTSLF